MKDKARKGKRLVLSRETLRRLDSDDLRRVAGGQTNICPQLTLSYCRNWCVTDTACNVQNDTTLCP